MRQETRQVFLSELKKGGLGGSNWLIFEKS